MEPKREVYFVGWTHLLDVSDQNLFPVENCRQNLANDNPLCLPEAGMLFDALLSAGREVVDF